MTAAWVFHSLSSPDMNFPPPPLVPLWVARGEKRAVYIALSSNSKKREPNNSRDHSTIKTLQADNRDIYNSKMTTTTGTRLSTHSYPRNFKTTQKNIEQQQLRQLKLNSHTSYTGKDDDFAETTESKQSKKAKVEYIQNTPQDNYFHWGALRLIDFLWACNNDKILWCWIDFYCLCKSFLPGSVGGELKTDDGVGERRIVKTFIKEAK